MYIFLQFTRVIQKSLLWMKVVEYVVICHMSLIETSRTALSTHKDKKEEIWPSPMTKAPTPTEMSKGQSDNTNNATKSSINQQLRTDLGRSVGVTKATQLVWLTWFTGPPSYSPQQPCNQKDTQTTRNQTYAIAWPQKVWRHS